MTAYTMIFLKHVKVSLDFGLKVLNPVSRIEYILQLSHVFFRLQIRIYISMFTFTYTLVLFSCSLYYDVNNINLSYIITSMLFPFRSYLVVDFVEREIGRLLGLLSTI